ncbi:hypothetical protein [uncultured Draconibacterium sp.]|uniref:hypothetical protein n=1 Tax=uncultured Draconibacterium sp. TaxID=1573823 RepID=UPI0029C7CF14|nr:hypothetical protein [uncultured Draconibacterium sp.]
MDNLTQDIFLSYARFPAHAGVLKTFNSGRLDLPGYQELKAAVENLSEKSLVPGISDFVFGVDEKITRKIIDAIDDFYLMVDYGQITASRNRFEIEENSFYLAITVARPINADNMDMVEEMLISDQALNYLRQIRKHLKTEDRERRLKEVKYPNQAIPFVAPTLNSSIGWTMILNRANAGLL